MIKPRELLPKNGILDEVIVDMRVCDKKILFDPSSIELASSKILKKHKAVILKKWLYRYKGSFGTTIFFVLSGSHLFIETWPEYGYALCSVQTCGRGPASMNLAKDIIKLFKAREKTKIIRHKIMD